jgi:hypothetical protein
MGKFVRKWVRRFEKIRPGVAALHTASAQAHMMLVVIVVMKLAETSKIKGVK